MDFSKVIDQIMSEVKHGSDEPFIIYRNSDGGWDYDYTENSEGVTFDWVKDVREKDPLSVIFKGSDFANGSFPYVYDTVLAARIREEYYVARSSGRDTDELNALASFFIDNIGVFSSEVTDHLAQLDRPLAALQRMDIPPLSNGDVGYSEDRVQSAIGVIENRIAELHSRKDEEIRRDIPQKRNIEGYDEITSIQLAGRIVVLAENPGADNPYMVCNIRWDNPLGLEERYDGVVTDNYLEAIGEFIDRQTALLGDLRDERTPGFPFHKVTAAECVPGSLDTDLEGKVIILKPEYRTAEHQYALCTGGFGAKPDSRGNSVYAKNLFNGKESRYERHDVAGVADPAKMPEWVKTKLAEMETSKEPRTNEQPSRRAKSTVKKPSLLGKLDDNKQKVERDKSERKDKPVTKKPGDLEVD